MAKKFLLGLVVCLGLLIGNNARADLVYGDFTYTESGGEIMITGYTGPGGDVVIPDTIDSMPVVSIFDYAFYNSTGLTGVTIPASVNSIGFSVFESCTDLAGITVDENNSDYSSLDGILYNKDKTELVICPEGKVGTITIPGSVAFIGDSAFYSCTGLTGITIPDSVVYIGGFAFYDCTGLTSVAIPDSVIYLGGLAFYDCTGLTSVTIGDGLNGIGDYAFDGCISLTSVAIGSNVAIIGREAFNKCRSLTTVSIPASVTDIHDYAFLECDSLSVVYFLGNAPSTMGESVFYSCDPYEPYCDPTTPDICYTAEGIGFTTPIWEASPWESYPAAPCACSDDTNCAEGETCVDGVCEIVDQPPVFLSEPRWAGGVWPVLSTDPANPHKPKSEHVIFFAYDDDSVDCGGVAPLKYWMYRPVELQAGVAVPLGDGSWTYEVPGWSFMHWVLIEEPTIADTTGLGLFEFKLSVTDCHDQTTDTEGFWGKRYYFLVEE